MKKLNKAISLFLALVLLLSCSSVALAENDTPITKPNAVVLVLDVSGSMRGERIIKLKEATNKFAEKLIEGGTNNKIAIVTFASSCSTLPFTNDLIEIKHFMSTKTASGGTNMTSGINNADSLLSNEELTNYNKSIVIMSDGEPDNIDSAKSAATALFDKYNIYSVGLNLSSNQKAFMQSIQNKGYFDADSVDELVEKFVEVVEEILPLFDIQLSYGKPEYTIVISGSGKYYSSQVYITAKVTNKGNKSAKNVKVKIKLPAGLDFITDWDSSEESVQSIPAGNTEVFGWTVGVKNVPISTKEFQYSVVAGADNVVALEKFQTIIFTPDESHSRRFSNSDMWSFSHSAMRPYNYSLRQDFVDYLLNTIQDNAYKEHVGEKIKQAQSGDFGGVCYGLSKSAILFKNGDLEPGYWSLNKNCTNELSVEEVRDLVTYYYFTQYTREQHEEYATFKDKSVKDTLQILMKAASNVKFGGSPALVQFDYDRRADTGNIRVGHAIVAYDMETSKENNGQSWVINGKEYTTRIITYDVNTSEGVANYNNRSTVENSYIYITADGSDWTIPKYSNNSSTYPDFDNVKDLFCVSSNAKILNSYNIEKRDYISDEQKNKTAFLTATAIKNQIKAKITNDKNQSSVVDGKNISGDLNVWSYVDYYDVDDNILPKNSTINYIFDDVNSSYEFAPTMPGQEYDVQMLYQNCGYRIEAESLVNAKFVPEKSVDVKSGGGKISARMTLNKGYYGLPWYTITVSSNNAKAIGLTKNENGIIVNSDNFSNLVVTGKNDDETKQITLNTESNSVLITEKDNSLVACVDNNNDGTYETVIASSDGDVSPQLESLETKDFKLIPGFNPALRYYISFVSNSVSKISLAPTMNSETTATISVNGSKYEEFKSEFTTELKTGINIIKITVTDTKGNSNEYVLTVVKGLWSMIQPGLVLIVNISVAIIKVIVQYIIYFFKLLM